MMFRQERLDVAGGRWVFGAQRLEVLIALGRRQVEQPIEMRAGTLPAVGARSHSYPACSISRSETPVETRHHASDVSFRSTWCR